MHGDENKNKSIERLHRFSVSYPAAEACCSFISSLITHTDPFKASPCPCEVMKSQRGEQGELGFDLTAAQKLDTLIKWPMMPPFGLQSSRWELQMFPGHPAEWEMGKHGQHDPGATFKPRLQSLHVPHTVNQPCKPLPSWLKAPLCREISKQPLQ